MTDTLSNISLDSGTALWAMLGIIVVFFALFLLFKGVIKLMLLLVALTAAAAWWVVTQRMGFTYLELVVNAPKPWMVQTIAWGGAAFILLLYFHIRMWAAQLFSMNRRAGAGTILTTVLMGVLLLWVAIIGISYYGDVCRIRYYHDLAVAQKEGRQEMPSKPWFTSMKEELNRQSGMNWLMKLNPMENPAQTNLACLLAYGCTFDEPTYTAIYHNQLADRGIPQPTRLLDLFGDAGLRTLVEQERFVTLLENDRLTTFLQFRNTEELVKNLF